MIIAKTPAPIDPKFDIPNLTDMQLSAGVMDILEKIMPQLEKQFFNLSRNEAERRPHYFYQKEVLDYIKKLIDKLKQERENQNKKQ